MASLPELCVANNTAGADDAAPLFQVRRAIPADVLALMDMKRQMATAEGMEILLGATVADWLRDGFGAAPRFLAFVAERDGAVVGMVTFNERNFTGWALPTIYIQDIYVEPQHRKCGIGRALLSKVAAFAQERRALFVEMNARADNPACRLYGRIGFRSNADCLTFVLIGPALSDLAKSTDAAPPPDERDAE